MASSNDYYELLGVSKTATADELKRAYRKLAKQYHPDSYTGDDKTKAEEKFKEISTAYSVLSDDSKRAQYDRFGSGFENAGFGGASGFNGASGFGGFDFSGFNAGGMDIDLEDILGSVFGGGFSSGKTSNRPSKGADIRYNMTLTFEEAVFGCKKEVTVIKTEKCEDCSGTGARKGTSSVTCDKCGGKGKINVVQNTIMGAFSSTRECDKCKGTGKYNPTPCDKCGGKGIVKKNRKIEVNIPAGIDDNQAVSIAGQGDIGKNGGPNGDLFIVVKVAKHKEFVRDGSTIKLNHKIPYTKAVLGGSVSVPTIDGQNAEFNINEGTASETKFKLKGKGVPSIHGSSRGDMEVTISIDVPKRLNEKQKELLKAFADSMGEEITKKKSIFSR